jgi:uncharacterized protein (DUF1330 family)
MMSRWTAVAIVTMAAATAGPAAAGEGPVYELRTYHASPGKLDALNARFREHTCKLFEKHGMTNVAYFTPADEDQGRETGLIYLLKHDSLEAAKASWQAFRDDPEWQSVKAASEKDGVPLAAKVESIYLDATDYSPDPCAIEAGKGPRVFELRTYHASPGKLANLNTRFREHTCKLFQKHGMTNVVYGTPRDPEKGRDDTLIYLLAFPDREAAKASWKAFGDDPQWQAVYKASQPDGVPLAAKVESIYLIPTDFSPLK